MQAYDRRTTPARSDLAAADLMGKVEAERYVHGEPRRVRDAVLDLRRSPGHDSPLETQALHGEPVTLYEDHEGWAWLQLDRDGYVGYAASDGLERPGAPATHRVNVPRTFVYAQASIKSSIVIALPFGATFAAADVVGEFTLTRGNGFVWTAHVTPLGTASADFVAVAERFLDVPYQWGGKTSLGLDCSALVQVSLAAAGIAAPRDSDLQERALGGPLPIDDRLDHLRRGDLVFWKGHVGIMRDAATLLHASGHHMLVVSEPLLAARQRIAARSFGAITSIRRVTTAP